MIIQDDQIRQYFSIYPSSISHIALCLIPPDDSQLVEHRFTSLDNLSKFLPYARFRNARGWNIYITPSVLRDGVRNRRKESFLDCQSIIYLDCDKSSCLDEIRSRYPYPALVIKTSLGRYQVYWRLSQPVDVEVQENLMRQMARDVGADHAATDVSRVLRLPSFWNRKPDRKPCTVDLVFLRNYAVDYKFLLLSLSEDLRSEMVLPHQTPPPSPPRVLAKSDSNGLSESQRDWYRTNYWISAGECVEVIIDRLIESAKRKRDPRYYALLTVKNALKEKGDQRHSWIDPRLHLFEPFRSVGRDANE